MQAPALKASLSSQLNTPVAMLDIHRDSGPATKFFFSHSLLPSYLDPQNVSTKKKPFSTFNAQPFSHTVCRPRPPDETDAIHITAVDGWLIESCSWT